MSLIELMISITVGLLVLLGLTTIYLNASRSNTEFARMNRQIENGRYALQILREDLWHAGFWGEYKPPQSDTAIPVDPCLPFASWSVDDRDNVLSIPIQGYDGDPAGIEDSFSDSTTCAVSNRILSTDVLVLRFASRCVAGTDCPTPTGVPRFQASLCATDTDPYLLKINTADLTLKGKACTGLADQRNFVSHIYYVRNYANTDGDGIPTLMRWAYGEAGPQPLVEGIEHLELEYGIDTNGDGNVDEFRPTPTEPTPSAEEWRNVVGIKVYILARNLDATAGHEDDKTYSLGAEILGPFNDGFKRHVYSSFVRLNNPSMRREGQGGTGGTEGSDTETSGNDNTGTEPTVTDTSNIGDTL